MKSTVAFRLFAPLLFCFFVMGFVDVVGIATSYVKQDFALNDKIANLLPMIVFLWFAVISLPSGLLMDKIGRKRTVQLSALITSVGMFIPFITYSFGSILFSFCLLGIGNTILQVSLNPLVTDVVAKERITGMLTLGQFVKAISSTLGPILTSLFVGYWGNWQLIFPLYGSITLVSWIWMTRTHISSDSSRNDDERVPLKDILRLFTKPYLLMCFLMILLSVGFEIGLMTVVPKYLKEVCALPIEKGSLGCSLYFLARTLGTFIGSIVLVRISPKKYLNVNVVIAILFFLIFTFISSFPLLLVSLFFIGFCCANIFPIVFSEAIQYLPEKANVISALMIMGVAGGALIPPVMGIISDLGTQQLSLSVPLLILICIYIASFYLKSDK